MVRVNYLRATIAMLVALAVAATAAAQLPGEASGVRGLYDEGDPAARLTQPIGAAAAPPASFEAPASPETPGEAPTDPSASAFPPVPIEGGEIIARVDGQVVLASDVMWQANYLMTMSTQPIPPEQIPQVRQYLMRQLTMGLIDTKLLYSDFRRTVPADNLPQIEATLSKPFEEVEVPRLLKMMKLKDRPALDSALKENGTTLKDVQRQFAEKTIAGEWLNQKTPKSNPITHDEMLEHYQEHISEYQYEAQVKWEELMVRLDRFQGDRDAAWTALAAMGNEAWTKIRANPTSRDPMFADIAKARSQGFTADKGGFHDWMTMGALKSAELNAALANLPLGQMSEGIESEQGFHIVRVIDRKAAGCVPFTEAQTDIRKALEIERKSGLKLAQLEKLRKSARVWTIFDGELNGARLSEALQEKQRR